MQKISIRVRGSPALKLLIDTSEKGSASIVTDSSAMARVEVEVLISVGLICVAANTELNRPQANTISPAHNIEMKRLRKAKARFVIDDASLWSKTTLTQSTMRLTKLFGGGATGRLPRFNSI